MTIGGFSVASPGLDSGTNRSVAVDFLSLNNLSRIEVEFAPTPESQGGALAGTVQIIAVILGQQVHRFDVLGSGGVAHQEAQTFRAQVNGGVRG